MPNQQFNVVAKITGYTLRKDANGVEKVVLTGLASNTNIDLTGERMADTAIEAMAKSLEANPVMLNNEHDHQWDADFGEVTKLWVNDAHELMMEAEADPDHYRTKTLMRALDKGKQLGLSIGGFVIEAAMEWFAEAGRKVMTYKDISLYHVAITGTPAVAATWVAPITKSVKDWKDTDMTLNNDENHTTDKPAEDEVTVETTDAPASESDQPTDPQPLVAPIDAPTEDQPATPTNSDAPAAGQQDEVATPDGDEAAKSAADQAEAQLRSVAKAKLLGSWAESSITDAAIDSLTWNLRNALWSPMYTRKDDTRSKDERIAEVAAVLTEYHNLILAVSTALINTGVDETATDVERNVRGTNPADLTKSLSDKDAAITEVTTARDEVATKLAELTKTVTGKDEEIATLTKRADDTEVELTTTKATLAETEKDLATIRARKSFVFGKFDATAIDEKKEGEPAKQSVGDAWMQHELGTAQERTAA